MIEQMQGENKDIEPSEKMAVWSKVTGQEINDPKKPYYICHKSSDIRGACSSVEENTGGSRWWCQDKR